MTVLGHVPVLTTIISVSPKLAGISFSFQDDALTGFIILYRRPLPPFTVIKQIQSVRKCLEITVLAVYLAIVNIYSAQRILLCLSSVPVRLLGIFPEHLPLI